MKNGDTIVHFSYCGGDTTVSYIIINVNTHIFLPKSNIWKIGKVWDFRLFQKIMWNLNEHTTNLASSNDAQRIFLNPHLDGVLLRLQINMTLRYTWNRTKYILSKLVFETLGLDNV